MFRFLLALFIVVTAVELYGLISVGRLIGGWQTTAIVLLTGFLGAYFAKREGRKVLDYARHRMSMGEIPTDAIVDGICIFAGGLLLLTPGFLTDVVGATLVFPATRPIYKGAVLRLIRKRLLNRSFYIDFRR